MFEKRKVFNNSFGVFALMFVTSQAFAHGAGNGGIDIRHQDGATEPAESYLERHTSPAMNVCDLMNASGQASPTVWKESLNKVTDKMYDKLPRAGTMIAESFKATYFYFLELEPGDQIIFTNDDGSPVAAPKFNGAIRIKNEVYIDKTIWQNYWQHRKDDKDVTLQMTRVLHEALLGNYVESETRDLGRMVNEMLRLADFYPVKNGPFEFAKKSGKEVADVLVSNGLGRAASDYSTTLDYFDEKQEKIIQRGASWQNPKDYLVTQKRYEDAATKFKAQLERMSARTHRQLDDSFSVGHYFVAFNSEDAKIMPLILQNETEYYYPVESSLFVYGARDPRPEYLKSLEDNRPIVCR